MPQAPAKAPVVILPPGPTPPDVPRRDPVPQVTPAKVPTAVKGGAAVIIAAPVAVGLHQGWDWTTIGLSAFIAVGLVTAVVLLVRKFRS